MRGGALSFVIGRMYVGVMRMIVRSNTTHNRAARWTEDAGSSSFEARCRGRLFHQGVDDITEFNSTEEGEGAPSVRGPTLMTGSHGGLGGERVARPNRGGRSRGLPRY